MHKQRGLPPFALEVEHRRSVADHSRLKASQLLCFVEHWARKSEIMAGLEDYSMKNLSKWSPFHAPSFHSAHDTYASRAVRVCAELPTDPHSYFLCWMQMRLQSQPSPAERLSNCCSDTHAWWIRTQGIRFRSGGAVERNKRSDLFHECKNVFSPRHFHLESASLLSKNVSEVNLNKELLKHKVKTMYFSPVRGWGKILYKSAKEEKKSRPTEDRKEKGGLSTGTLRSNRSWCEMIKGKKGKTCISS